MKAPEQISQANDLIQEVAESLIERKDPDDKERGEKLYSAMEKLAFLEMYTEDVELPDE